MSGRRLVTAPDAPPALGAYSPAVAMDGWIFVSGQVGWDADGRGLNDRGPGEQAAQALRNVEALLRGAGASLKDVLRVTVYVDDFRAMGEIDAAYRQVMADAGVDVLPARTAIGADLPVAVEIDAIAKVST